METTAVESLNKLIVANALAIAVVVAKELWSTVKDSTKENTKALKELSKSLGELNREIMRLQTQMEYVHKDLSIIPEVRRDLDLAHAKIRELTLQIAELKGGQ